MLSPNKCKITNVKRVSIFNNVYAKTHYLYGCCFSLNKDGKIVTDGGRNFTISAKGKDVAAARALAYAASAKIKCKNLFYRKDIAA